MAGRSTGHRLSDPVPYEYDVPPSPTTRSTDSHELAGSTFAHSISPTQPIHEPRSNATWAARIHRDESVPSSLESSQHVDPSSASGTPSYPVTSSSAHKNWSVNPSPEESKRQRQFSANSEIPSSDKRSRYGLAPIRQASSSSSFPIQDVSRQMQAIGVSGASLPGAFATPARNPSLRKDSLRSVASPSGIRMDRAALAATGFSAPRAPQLSKFDTPVCEYDGTPLGVGLGGFAGMRDGLALGRKNSLNRIIMDEGLARQLDVEKVGAPSSLGRRHTAGIARGRSLLDGSDDTVMDGTPTHNYVNQNEAYRRRFHPALATTSTSKAVLDGESTSRAAKVAELAHDAEMNHVDAAEEAEQWQKPEERFFQAQRAAEQEAALEDSRPSKPKHIVTPSNQHMGFELDPAREVVPSDVNQEAVSMMSICVLAVESIWPQSRTRDDWSYRSSMNAPDGSAPSRGVLPLSHFVREVLRRSRTLPNTLQIALYYLHQSRRSIRSRVALAEEAKRTYKTLLASGKASSGLKSPEGQTEAQDTELQNIMKAMSDPVLCGRRMFLASLMCASKYLQDRNFSNRAWAKISGLPVKEVNANERTFLFLVEYRLHVELDTFSHWIIRLQKLADDKGTPTLKGNAVVTPLKTPTKPEPVPSTPSTTRQSAPITSTAPSSAVTSPLERLVPRVRPAIPRTFIEPAEVAAPVSRVAAAPSPRVVRTATTSSFGGAYDPPTHRNRRPSVMDPSTSIAVPTYSDLIAEREATLVHRRREEHELHSLRNAERAAAIAAVRARDERLRHEERARQNSYRRAQRERDEPVHQYRGQEYQSYHAVPNAAAATASYMRAFRTAASQSNTMVEDDVDRSDMDIDLSSLRDRPPSSCGMQDSNPSLLSTAEMSARNGHAMTGLDEYGHRLNHLNPHHHQYGVNSRWGAPPHIY